MKEKQETLVRLAVKQKNLSNL